MANVVITITDNEQKILKESYYTNVDHINLPISSFNTQNHHLKIKVKADKRIVTKKVFIKNKTYENL